MKRKVLLSVPVFLLLGIIGCQNRLELKEETGVTLENLGSAPEAIVSKEELPEWLQERITVPELGTPFYWVQIFKGEWENRIVYSHRCLNSSSLSGYLFYENGEPILLLDMPTAEYFYSTSKNWVLIWKHGENSVMWPNW